MTQDPAFRGDRPKNEPPMLDIQTLASGYLLLCIAGAGASLSLLWAAGPACAASEPPGVAASRRIALAAVLLVALSP